MMYNQMGVQEFNFKIRFLSYEIWNKKKQLKLNTPKLTNLIKTPTIICDRTMRVET